MTDKLPPLPPHEDGGQTTQPDPNLTARMPPHPPGPPPPPRVPMSSTQPARPTRELPQVSGTGHVQRVQQQGTPPAQPPVRRNTTTNMQPVYRKRPSTADARRDSGLYLPLWSLGLMLIAVLAASFAVVMFVLALGSSVLPTSKEPVIRIITAVPTLPGSVVIATTIPQQPGSETLSGQNPPDALALSGPTLAPVVFTPTPQAIVIGSNIIVAGVGADELNIRDKAGVLGTNILFRVKDGEFFTVVEGPMQSDGFTWWRIQSTTNATENGWAVANYLQVLAQ